MKVKNGTRLKFVNKDINENICNNRFTGWWHGYNKITYNNINQEPEYYSVDVGLWEDVCVYEFNMTFTSNSVPDSSIIYFKQQNDQCCTYKICSGNVTANFIMVIFEHEDESTETTNCKVMFEFISVTITMM